jgi:hypothetical protein
MTTSSFETNSHPVMASAQPPQGLPGGGGPMGDRRGQAAPDFGQKLSKYALPGKAIAESDIAGIKTVIDAVCAEISSSIKSAGQKVDYEVIKSGLLGFQIWLKRQKCIEKASTRYDIESTEKYTNQIFFTYPGTLAFDIDFKMAGNTKKPYRLLLFVTKADLLNVASLVENSTIDGVPVPKDWPNNPWSYWNARESYWKNHP